MTAEFLISLAALPLRLILGIVYIIYGFTKIKSPERTATLFLKLGIQAPKLSAILVAILEFFGGIALIIGFSTRVVAALLAIQMAAAIYLKKKKMKKNLICPFNYDLILTAALIILFFLGAGVLSIDHMFGWLLG